MIKRAMWSFSEPKLPPLSVDIIQNYKLCLISAEKVEKTLVFVSLSALPFTEQPAEHASCGVSLHLEGFCTIGEWRGEEKDRSGWWSTPVTSACLGVRGVYVGPGVVGTKPPCVMRPRQPVRPGSEPRPSSQLASRLHMWSTWWHLSSSHTAPAISAINSRGKSLFQLYKNYHMEHLF